MKVSRNSYYNWLSNKDNTNERLKNLKARIKHHFFESSSIYGSTRIQKKLKLEGFVYSVSYIGKLMRKMGLKSILKRKFIATTQSKHDNPVAENILNRDFTSTGLGEKWVSDITYIPVGKHWNYLTTIIDLADRKVVGWNLSEDMTTENTVYKTWINARKTRDIGENLVFHSDRGVQYTSKKIGELLNSNTKVVQSMSRKGNCWDNAVAESFFKTIKYECLNRYSFENKNQLYQCIKEYIKWYNTERLHSFLGYITPLQMEKILTDNKYKIRA
jgi:transposase InsO family protein